MKNLTPIPLLEVGGFTVGHAQDYEAATGCTVLLFDACSPAGVAVRGGGPASRETPLLDPLAASEGIHGLLLSGGSAFGLDAAGGVMKYLEERNIGFDTGITKVPLVCQSCVFDLVIGRPDVRPDPAMAYKACEDGDRRKKSALPVPEGNQGVGCGCTVGKYRGPQYAMKSGLGCFAVQAGRLKVGAIVAVNALGDVFDIDTGLQIAGLLNQKKDGLLSTEEEFLKDIAALPDLFTGNTTIGAVITNGSFTKAQVNKIASMAHNGLARTIRPVHTTADGDSVYAVSAGAEPADINVAGTLASYVLGVAVNRAVRTAHSSHGYLCSKDVVN
ncbi:MAG: P1 family peptidase [Lachnospiraceae bacterium]|nr:P1 family peptidase [Lachnospiraceae bacterium]